MNNIVRLEDSDLSRYRKLSTSTLSDALDRLGIAGAVDGLRPTVEATSIVGRAFTVAYLPRGVAGGTVGDFLDDLGAGDVVVIDNRGRTDCTVWGNIMTEVAKRNRVEGTVIDGVNRDLAESREIGYPVWSRHGHMRTGKDRVVLEAINVPVSLGGIRVEPGDIVCADANGVVVVPLSRALEVLETAESVEAREDMILDEIRSGTKLSESREKHGYHSLQTRSD